MDQPPTKLKSRIKSPLRAAARREYLMRAVPEKPEGEINSEFEKISLAGPCIFITNEQEAAFSKTVDFKKNSDAIVPPFSKFVVLLKLPKQYEIPVENGYQAYTISVVGYAIEVEDNNNYACIQMARMKINGEMVMTPVSGRIAFVNGKGNIYPQYTRSTWNKHQLELGLLDEKIDKWIMRHKKWFSTLPGLMCALNHKGSRLREIHDPAISKDLNRQQRRALERKGGSLKRKTYIIETARELDITNLILETQKNKFIRVPRATASSGILTSGIPILPINYGDATDAMLMEDPVF